MSRVLWLLCALIASGVSAAYADWREGAQTAVHMLDYIGVDYPEFVKDGKVLNNDEYNEQREFAAQVVTLLRGLPQHAAQAGLIQEGERLIAQVAAKAPATEVVTTTRDLRAGIVQTYQLVVAPRQVPNPTIGATLYAQQCAGCHGVEGRGDGPAGKGLEPAPSDFHDAARMNSRSVYGLYNTITLGVAGTGMTPYKQLSEDERWALAFFASRLALSDADLAKGEAAWKSGTYRTAFSNLRDIVVLSTDEAKGRLGPDGASAHQWLRAHPEAVVANAPSPIQFSIDTLRESLVAYNNGQRAQAQQLAVTAYLEGFELVEASLDNVDADLRTEIERQMMAYRNLLKSDTSRATVEAQVTHLVELLETARTKVETGELSPGATFTASFLILLREGLEAILVLAAIVTFLIKSGRRDALPWVHVGWVSALVLGAVTWFVATYVVSISGANREVTEGVTALVAAGMLLYVGLWLHSKSHSRAWQRFINDRVGTALAKRTLWAMAAVSFLAVYREMFEIVLFYQALWAQAGSGANVPLFGGIGAAAVLLAAIGWAMFRYGIRLPIGPFFTVTAILLAVLAVIFAGHGVAALQEAGWVDADVIPFVRVPPLGIYPTLQTLAAQAFAATAIGIGFYLSGRQRSEAT